MEINEIKERIESLGSDSLSVFGGKYEGGINLQQVVDEITPCIYDILSLDKKFKNFMEIGSAAGGNTRLFDEFFNFDNVVIIDDNQHQKHQLRPENLKHIKYKLIEFVGDSHTNDSLIFANSLNMKFDIMFIDGDHSYEGVKNDVDMYIHLLNDDGLVFFHDTKACDGVGRIFNELCSNNNLGLVYFNEYTSKTHHRQCGIGVLVKKNN